MALSQKILPHYTYADYLLWEGRWELIDGFPIAMSPSPLTSTDGIYQFEFGEDCPAVINSRDTW